MKPLFYYLNKYFYFPPYLLWVWIGKNIGFKGVTFLERFVHMNDIKKHLEEKIPERLLGMEKLGKSYHKLQNLLG